MAKAHAMGGAKNCKKQMKKKLRKFTITEREDCKRIVSEDCCQPAGKLLLSLQGEKRMDTDGLNRKCGSTTAEAVSTLTWNSHSHTQLTTHRDLARLEFN